MICLCFAPALPADTALTVKRNGFPISGNSAYPAKVTVGDEVQLECYSKLGSIPNTEIEWWKTSSVGDIREQIQQNNVKFIKYNPGAFGSNGVETSGPIHELDAECSREQTTTLRYNVSKADQVRGIVAFKCYVQVTPPVSGSSPNVQLDQVIVNSTSFYMEIGMLNILLFSSHLYIAPDNLFSPSKIIDMFPKSPQKQILCCEGASNECPQHMLSYLSYFSAKTYVLWKKRKLN